jgi:hypothetical protein
MGNVVDDIDDAPYAAQARGDDGRGTGVGPGYPPLLTWSMSMDSFLNQKKSLAVFQIIKRCFNRT